MHCRRDGTIFNNDTGDVACDHYHRYREDAALMKQIGLRGYRMSISWPRVMPEGAGRVNEAGLAFYDRLVDELLGAGVHPFVTLFHWDYPYELYTKGGWLNADSSQWFAEYTEVVARRLGDRVRHWMTLNEPQVFINMGHRTGQHAPGLRLDWPDVLRALHHSLLAHGRGVQALRSCCREKPMVGWAPVGVVRYPASSDPRDVDAARQAMFWSGGRQLWNNTLYSDPVCLGRYPEEALRDWGRAMPKIGPGDMKTIQQPLDFYGMNIYNGQATRAGDDGQPQEVPRPSGYPLSVVHWPMEPLSLYWGPRFLAERYRLPVMVTENGISCMDWVHTDGRVHDPQRIDFTKRYLRELGRAIRDGVDVRGYFHWTIMDNFEWAEGHKHRFGLIHVDFQNQKRTLKDSAYWYAEVIRTNGAVLEQD
jgi:beta-glucosidase